MRAQGSAKTWSDRHESDAATLTGGRRGAVFIFCSLCQLCESCCWAGVRVGHGGFRFGCLGIAHRWSVEREAIGVVDEAVEDGISKGRFVDDLVPCLDRQLAGDQRRAGAEVCAARRPDSPRGFRSVSQ